MLQHDCACWCSTGMNATLCRMNTVHRIAIVFLCMLAFSGCGSFDRQWESLEEEPAPLAGMEGRWKGTWYSETTDHTGVLRCIIERDDEGVIRARYHATYAMGLTFEYRMPMEVERRGDVLYFNAEADLGLLAGGVYQYEGTVEGDEFRSTYTSKGDSGTFQMTRVPEDEPDEHAESSEVDDN